MDKTEDASAEIAKPDQDSIQVEQVVAEPLIEYGIHVDSYRVVKSEVKKNQFLSDILVPNGVPYSVVDQMAREYKEIFDVRRIRYGKPYALYCSRDSLAKVCYFVYEEDAVNYIVYKLADSLVVSRGKKPVDTLLRIATGVISSSLYLTLDEQDASPALAIELSEVFAWIVDFYAIQKGDWFKVIYEEIQVDGERVGIGEIKAAVFSHFGKPNYAIRFKQDEISDYFDDNNNSCRRAFLKAPLKFSRISSRYSGRRFHPVQKRWKAHLGTDYAAPKGTPIMATGNGVVTHAAYTKGNGNYVKIRHNSVYSTQYLHMTGFAKGIRSGVRVEQGQTIGYVGSTGLATGPHVCYRFWKNGKQVDALKVDIPPSEPIAEEYVEAYEKLKDRYKVELDRLELPRTTEDLVAIDS